MKKIAMTTFGCRANQYDSGALASLIEKGRLKLVDLSDQADIYVFNTCAITHAAENEARRLLEKVRKNNPKAVTIVTGCSAQVSPEDWQKRAGVNYVVGNLDKEKVIELITREVGQNDEGNFTPESGPEIYLGEEGKRSTTFYAGGVLLPEHSRSFLKIQDGCSQFCSFCIVPFARGLNRSIEPERIMASLYQLRDQGIHEVVITGIHLGTYGKDLSPKTSLLDLLRLLDRERPVPRIRLSSIDPEEMTPEMIELLAGSDLFCPHLHLPLQSGDDGVLRRMRRRYLASHFRDLTRTLVERIPDLCLGTDVIVGFPGEDDSAFQNTYRLIEDTPVAYVHTFPYSIRKGTKAAQFSGQVDDKVKKERSRLIRELSDRKRLEYNRQFEGRVLELVREDRKGQPSGLSGNYISVDLDVPGEKSGLVSAKIVSVTSKNVQGMVVAPLAFSC